MSGRNEKARRREILHRRQLFGGTKTAEQVFREHLRGRCTICGGPPAIRLRSIAAVADLRSQAPQYLAAIAASRPGQPIPTFETVHGPAVIIGVAYACGGCRVSAERAAAHGPSWIHVEIDRGPGPESPIVGVPS